MKTGHEAFEPDAIDLQILSIMQEHGRIALTKLAEQVGLSAPSVIERVKKLEDIGVITGYHAAVDARKLGKDVTAFIGVSIGDPRTIEVFEETVQQLDDILECHHVTGEYTVLLKVKQIGGAACHEGYKSCFFRQLDDGELKVIAERIFDPKAVYKK